MKPLAPNTMIQNRYLIVQPIGKGGMGEVYLAVDQRLGSAVALKRTFFRQDEELGNAFEREARILGRLRHPVLPKVIDHFSENGDQFLIMEHISGDDLSKRLENAAKPFPLSWVMFWADQLLDALTYLHSHEPPIIHRDIKPQNLKLTDENHIILLDFGLSKDFDSRSSSQPMHSGSVVGYSPFFASMEQVRGTGTDARSDIYSLSATLYQMLTNSVPPDSLARADILLSGAKDPISGLNEINPEVPVAVSDVILKGIAVRQDERYSTALEMQKALRRAFGQAKTDIGEKTAIMDTVVPTAIPASQVPETEVSEMATRTHIDTDGMTGDATMQMGQMGQMGQMSGQQTGAEPVKQSELRTEVFGTGDLGAAVPVNEIESHVVEIPIDGPAPAVVENQPPATIPVKVSAAPLPDQAMPVIPPQAKKSKVGIIVGGFLGLLVFFGLVAGGGWYAYKNFYNVAGPPATPTPAPTPAPTVAPTPEPTVLVESDQNVNSNSVATQVSESNSQVSESNTSDPDANRMSQSNSDTVTTRPNTGTKNVPPRTSQTPAVKPTPKPKQRDERTLILP